MCPKRNVTKGVLSKKSHIEDLEKRPIVFKAITSTASVSDTWTALTFPVDIKFKDNSKGLTNEVCKYILSY